MSGVITFATDDDYEQQHDTGIAVRHKVGIQSEVYGMEHISGCRRCFWGVLRLGSKIPHDTPLDMHWRAG